MTRLLVAFMLVLVYLSACISTRNEPAGPRPEPREQSSSPASAKTKPYEVFGQRYYPITDATGYRKRGVASWYGGKFHGRKTANGERYDMHKFTAAHTTLPLPTLVKVTNLRNGLSVVVRVNDRGPFVKNRLIDLSYAAAQKLDMVGDGTTLVEVEAIVTADAEPAIAVTPPPIVTQTSTATPRPVLPVPAEEITQVGDPATAIDDMATTELPAPAPSATADTADTGAATIYVQVGAFGEYTNAQRMQSSLYNAGIGQVRLKSGDHQGIPVHRVQVGPIASVPDYDVLITQLESIGISETHLVTE